MIVRTVDIVLIAALLGSAAWTFKVKNDSEQALARVADLEAQIAREREAIALLRADWSLLTSPDRLARLVERHQSQLGLEAAKPDQFIGLGEIPEKVPQFHHSPDIERAEAAGPFDSDLGLTTGSVGQ